MTGHLHPLAGEKALTYSIGASTVGADMELAAQRGYLTLHEDDGWESRNSRFPQSICAWLAADAN